MGIRSDVAVAIKSHIYTRLSPETMKLLKEDFDEEEYSDDNDRLFTIESIKWYTDSDEDIVRLYKELERFDEEDYLIVEACSEYPESDGGSVGNWHDNPWGIYKNVSVTIGRY